jgi:DNA polymerase-3 subunit alpha
VKGPGAKDQVTVYIKDIKQMKKLSPSLKVNANEDTLAILEDKFGSDNLRVV